MSNKKKKKNNNSRNRIKQKKVLDGIDIKNNNKNYNNIIKDIRNDEIKLDLEKGKHKEKITSKEENNNINEKIQSFISILFTIIIFILLIFIFFVIYDKYIKKENINLNEVCKDYIKKDYQIKEEDILNYIKNNRSIIYNIDKFDNTKIENEDILLFSTYIVWDNDSEYTYCDDDSNCLDTKKEMEISELEEKLNQYYHVDIAKVLWPTTFNEDDKTRLYLKDDKVVLTFKRMEYETLKHDIVDIKIDENKIEIIFALSGKTNNIYGYVGSKKLYLTYLGDDFKINRIETKLNK